MFFGNHKKKHKPLTKKKMAELYHLHPDILQYIPWVDYDSKNRVFNFVDGRSKAAVFELFPADLEARPDEKIEELAESLTRALNTLPQVATGSPWVLQIYLQDEPIQSLSHQIRSYTKEDILATEYSKEYFNQLDDHLHSISREEGIFTDPRSGNRWRGRVRRIRCALYRHVSKADIKAGVLHPTDQLNEAA